MVHERGLEPPRPKALAPKASVSTNSTTRAKMIYCFLVTFTNLSHLNNKNNSCTNHYAYAIIL